MNRDTYSNYGIWDIYFRVAQCTYCNCYLSCVRLLFRFIYSSLFMAGPKLWNMLPNNVKQCSCIVSFKTALKTHIFVEAFGNWVCIKNQCVFIVNSADSFILICYSKQLFVIGSFLLSTVNVIVVNIVLVAHLSVLEVVPL